MGEVASLHANLQSSAAALVLRFCCHRFSCCKSPLWKNQRTIPSYSFSSRPVTPSGPDPVRRHQTPITIPRYLSLRRALKLLLLKPSPRSPSRPLHQTPRLSLMMAWRSSGASNRDLVENMWRHGLIKDQRVKDAFLKVDRAHYAPVAPYEDSPQSIGHKATISAPHMHATAAESLLLHVIPSASKPAPRVLDIGSGSGYLTHLLAELVGDQGLVVGLEHIQALRDLGEKNMGKSAEGRALLASGQVRFRVGDGRKGWVEEPREGEEDQGTGWDAIHVGAAAVELHQELVDQLKAPGRMFIPVEDDNGYDQYVWAIDKKEDGSVVMEKLFGVRYVPLTDAPKP